MSVYEDYTKKIERVLRFDRYIKYDMAHEFIEGLEDVHSEIMKIESDNPEDKANLIEAFIVGGLEKTGEIDDSGAHLAMFIDGLFQSLIVALRETNIPKEEALKRVLAWSNRDDCGYCDNVEEEMLRVLNEQEVMAYRNMIEGNILRELEEANKDNNESISGNNPFSSNNKKVNRCHSQQAAILKELYKKQNDENAYIKLCDNSIWEISDYYEMALIYENQQQFAIAFDWLSKGMSGVAANPHHPCSSNMERMSRRLLLKLGRWQEAIEKAWEKFIEYPSVFKYQDLGECWPLDDDKDKESVKVEWYQKALAIIDENASLDNKIEFYLQFNEIELLTKFVANASDEQLGQIGHNRGEKMAVLLKDQYPLLAARVYRAQGMRIVENKKSKYYDKAAEYLYLAKQLYCQNGQAKEWDKIVNTILVEHKRKSGFMAEFNNVLNDQPPRRVPSFQERVQMTLNNR